MWFSSPKSEISFDPNLCLLWARDCVLPKDREGEKSNVNQLWWTAAINQSVRLFIEKAAARTRIINIVSVLRVKYKEINLFYAALFCSSP